MISKSFVFAKLENLIEEYVEVHHQARAALYILPALENYYEFTRFMNALLSLLKRADIAPLYSWIYDSTRGCYKMVLLVKGSNRNDMTDITNAIVRIWKLYSPYSVQFISDIPINYNSIIQNVTQMEDIMNQIDFIPSIPQKLLPSHQRAFAISQHI